MLVTPAYAQAASGAADPFSFLLPLVLIFVVFYFLLIRPQQKKMKDQKNMLAAIRRGDKVVTGGGIIGTVTKVNDDTEVTVEIAKDIRVRVQRGLISTVIARTAPARGGGAREKRKEEDAPAVAQGVAGGLADGLRRFLGGKSR